MSSWPSEVKVPCVLYSTKSSYDQKFQGLMLLWTSTLPVPSAIGSAFAAIVFLGIGKSGQKLSENFLEYQFEEKIKPKKQGGKDGSTQDRNERSLGHTIFVNIWLFFPLVVGYIITVCLDFVFHDATLEDLFRFSALLMGATHLLFLIGSLGYSRQELPVESDLSKIHRIFITALRKLSLKYPTSSNSYYWKGYKQQHTYTRGEGVRLLPRVPRLFRWLDKAAIVKSEEEEDSRHHRESIDTQEKKKKICTVKDVRDVKSLVHIIYLGLTIFPYSLLIASGDTFFVAQASELKSVMNKRGNDISILFLIKSVATDMSEFTCFLISLPFRKKQKSRVARFIWERKAATIMRIGFGITCAVICGIIAWQVEMRRLSSKFTTVALVPQFVLLGMTEGLVDGGIERLFDDHVAKSLSNFEDSFSELVVGGGKLLIIPIVWIFSGWIKETIDDSHLDRYYLMLAIMNAVLLLAFAYYSVTYAYKEVCPEDEKVTTEERVDHAHQPDSEDAYQENTYPLKMGKSGSFP
ncbi:protein NRT1/ PTR FAMILY 5.4-like isoform X2 [Vigna angularis]|uniref:protein NRT1/ PTR FAMILY 5.4-like isoform X2 n=1 Tax=Phaseolus angularis TaxID=3914 RepID=UPI0022B3D40F|nr:protein NRT1/ PTR FAMILY 5.4-like isoform X2 [Vigna angularis]